MKREQIAAYARLSKEDGDCKEESNSIAMQKILLREYVMKNFSDYDLLEFCDDGYTGTNLNRPAMQRMLELVKDSKISCIIVKDFSRFARDYIELGSYLEQIFPFMGVRFISINDNYDSKNYQGSIGEIDVNFKNLLYDLYSKDLSQKVRSSIAIRKEQGQYLSSISPFGYEKDPNDRHGLVIAEDEAEIVRRVFVLALEGYSTVQIAKRFNEEQIMAPVEFKIKKGKIRAKPKGEKFLWTSSAVLRIIQNEVYIGNIAQRKFTAEFGSERKHSNSKKDWLISYNHHEPIIEKTVFEELQKRHRGKKKQCHREKHPLAGKVVCGCCGKNLLYRKLANPYFSCQARYTNNMHGCISKVNGAFLEEYVLFNLQERLQENKSLERLHKEEIVKLETKIKKQREKKLSLEKIIRNLKQENFEAYQKYVTEKTGNFQSNDMEVKKAEKELEKHNKILQKLEDSYIDLKNKKNQITVEGEFAVLSKEMLDCYIEKIIVHSEDNIEICWK